MGASQQLPGRQELEALGHAAFLNSRQQLANAELLLKHGRWPVAHALATLALEEIGKSFLCVRRSSWAYRSSQRRDDMSSRQIGPSADRVGNDPADQIWRDVLVAA